MLVIRLSLTRGSTSTYDCLAPGIWGLGDMIGDLSGSLLSDCHRAAADRRHEQLGCWGCGCEHATCGTGADDLRAQLAEVRARAADAKQRADAAAAEAQLPA